jgi:hypothetical protein
VLVSKSYKPNVEFQSIMSHINMDLAISLMYYNMFKLLSRNLKYTPMIHMVFIVAKNYSFATLSEIMVKGTKGARLKILF